MTQQRSDLKWNGWGRVGKQFELGTSEPEIWEFFRSELGMQDLTPRPPVSLDQLSVPNSRLSSEQLAAFVGRLAPDRVHTDRFERVFHARGRSTMDLIELRNGSVNSFPDAVLYPETTAEVAATLAYARAEAIAIIPFGGGSSVVGGITPTLPPGKCAVVTLDVTRLNALVELDPTSLTATFQAGIYGPELERALAQRGFTLGHTPQSFEFSTLGGWIAARGAGSESNRYGKAEDFLVAARVVTPTGELRTQPVPASAAGPDLNHVVAGSEGALGVIVDATVKIHPLPTATEAHGVLFRNFADGCAAVRQLVQEELPLSMLRLSDAPETRFYAKFKGGGGGGLASRLLKRALSAAGFGNSPTMLMVGLEGNRLQLYATLSRIATVCLRHGGLTLGSSIGASWRETRYDTPYLRDQLLDRGIFVETLETSTRWSNLQRLYDAVNDAASVAIRDNLGPPDARGFVMCHVSHTYHDGASLYFTFAFPRERAADKELFWAVKRPIMDAIVRTGGTISHHHGVGSDHAPWVRSELGDQGLDAVRGIKDRLDPNDIMNPGKWL